MSDAFVVKNGSKMWEVFRCDAAAIVLDAEGDDRAAVRDGPLAVDPHRTAAGDACTAFTTRFAEHLLDLPAIHPDPELVRRGGRPIRSRAFAASVMSSVAFA